MKFFENETQVIDVVDNILKADAADNDIHMVRPHGRKVFKFPKWYDRHGAEYISCSSIEVEHDGRHRHLVWPYSPDAEIKLIFKDGQVKIVSMRNVKNLALFCSDQKTLMKTWTARTMPGQEPIEKNFNLLCGSSDDPGTDPGPDPIPDPDPLPDACPPDDIYTPRQRWSSMGVGPSWQNHSYHKFESAFDGNITTTRAIADGNKTQKVTFSPPIPLDNSIADNVQFYIAVGAINTPSDRARVYVNNVEVLESSMPLFEQTPPIARKIVPTFAGDIGNQIETIEWNTTPNPWAEDGLSGTNGKADWDWTHMFGIEINGKLLVDDNVLLPCQNGDCAPDDVYKPRQMWSNGITGNHWTQMDGTEHKKENVFDGNLSTQTRPDADSIMKLVFSPPIILDSGITDNIKFYMSKAAKNPKSDRIPRVFVNGIGVDDSGINYVGSNQKGEIVIPTFLGNVGDSVSSIEWNTVWHGGSDGSVGNPRNDHTNMFAIYINDKMLVDLDIDYGC